MFRLVIFSVACCLIVGLVTSLRLGVAFEGSCHGTQFEPLPITDLSFLDNFIYAPAASRHNYHGVASGHPNFRQMREFELYYNLCITHNVTGPQAYGHAFGLGGRTLGIYSYVPKPNKPGVILTTQHPHYNDGEYPVAYGTQTITLTDYKTFAFLANCWTWTDGPEEKTWEVMSITPHLDEYTKRTIEEHAVYLGFDRENVVFINYHNC